MVFETQLDQVGIKKEEEKLQEMIDKKFNPHAKLLDGSLSPSPPETGPQGEILEQDPEVVEGGRGAFLPGEDTQFELDAVNSHPCMKNIKRCIEKMKSLFGEEWKAQPEQTPAFIRHLLTAISSPETHVNTKVFILKIVSNDPKLFKPYAKQWFEPIC
jgi:hypothetical protein